MKKTTNGDFEGFRKISNWTDDYRHVVDDYEAFVKTLVGLISDSLKRHGFEYPDVVGRAKDILSFQEKLQRPGKLYKDPLREITDLAGIRIVVQYEDEINEVQSILQKEFHIDRYNSIDKRAELEPDRFGYRSVHTIVRLTKKMRSLPAYHRFAPLKAEIQIRTVLQHAWAAAEHALVYKSGHEPEPQYRRRFVRLASLLELVDEQFINLRESEQGRWARVTRDIKRRRLDVLGIDTITLNRYCALGETPHRIKMIADRLGIYAQSNRDELQIYQDFMGVCGICGVQSIASLDQRLKQSADRAATVFSARDEHILKCIHRPWLTCPEYLLTTLLIASHRPTLKRSVIHSVMDIDPVFVDGILYAGRVAFGKRPTAVKLSTAKKPRNRRK